jgi:hypothetical protein
MPNIEVVVSPNIQLMRPPGTSGPPGASGTVRAARWQFWAAVVVALIGGVTTYLALRYGPGVTPQVNLPAGK